MELPNLTVHRLSGPVSLYYLTPSEQSGLPLIVLMGDIHQYRKGMCEPCECPKGSEADQKDCCMKVYDTRWLKALDVLAKRYPVDFYTEFSHMHTGGAPNDILFREFYKATWSCHQRQDRFREVYEKCPTENIRWHYVDIRYITSYLEGAIINSYHTHLSAVISTIKQYYSHPVRSSNTESLIHKLKKVTMKRFYYNLDRPDRKQTMTRALSTLQELLPILFTGKPWKQMAAELSDGFWDALISYDHPKSRSAILKQLRKIHVAPFQDVMLWRTLVRENLLANELFQGAAERWEAAWSAVPEKMRKGIETVLVDMGDFRKEVDYTPLLAHEEMLKVLDFYLILFHTKFMDVYYLARLIKPPAENDPGVLTFGFFGDFHTRSIVEMLRHPAFGYHVRTIQAADPDLIEYGNDRWDRCVRIEEPLRLVQDLEAHVQGRAFERYARMLAQEREGRSMNRVRTRKARVLQELSRKYGVRNNTEEDENWNDGVYGGRRKRRNARTRKST